MIIEEPFTASRRPIWLKITCFILILGASIPTTLYLRKHIKHTDQQDRILVVSRGYEGCSDDSPRCAVVNSTAKPLFIINPFA